MLHKIKTDTWISLLNKAGTLLVAVYFISMFIYPFMAGGWMNTHKVWHSWQSLNVGVLAFVSSLIAFNISRYNSNKQREREFVAARASLPQALSELTGYLKPWASLLVEAYDVGDTSGRSSRVPLDTKAGFVREVFSECIRHGNPDIAEHLANILMRLQVNDSRLSSLHSGLTGGNAPVVLRPTLISYMKYLGELQALVNNTFDFSRGEADFLSQNIGMGDMSSAYRSLNLPRNLIDELTNSTEDKR